MKDAIVRVVALTPYEKQIRDRAAKLAFPDPKNRERCWSGIEGSLVAKWWLKEANRQLAAADR